MKHQQELAMKLAAQLGGASMHDGLLAGHIFDTMPGIGEVLEAIADGFTVPPIVAYTALVECAKRSARLTASIADGHQPAIAAKHRTAVAELVLLISIASTTIEAQRLFVRGEAILAGKE